MPHSALPRRTGAFVTSAVEPLDLAVPRSATALMQQLQLLVGRERHRIWCGGTIAPGKLAGFAAKINSRYPIGRSTSQRAYDRRRGRAVVHFLAIPHGGSVAWWLVSDRGAGGLADPAAPDAGVARDAMSAHAHIVYADYVLLYASKREPRAVPDRRSGTKTIFKQVSSWTWKLRGEVMSELRAGIDTCCARLEYGDEGGPGRPAWGLRGLLAAQRSRPLFSGVRTQVLELHRYARDAWRPQRSRWLARHPELARRYGASAGALRPIADILTNRLPKMSRVLVYDDPPRTLRSLCEPASDEPTA